MKTPLCTELDLGAGHIVLDGFPALRERGTAPPTSFRPMSIVATVAHLSYCWALVQDGSRHLGFLNFRNFNSRAGQEVQAIRHLVKFRNDRSNRCGDMATFRFFKTASAAILDL